ncbi:MAG: hypothetical protein NTW87_06055 [Planctomycetota bacterium]|nr:hypothetical protein [Planctomycetota bacterium]
MALTETPVPSLNSGTPSLVASWVVAHTKPRCEKRLVEFLNLHNVGSFLPLVTRRHVYGRRVRDYEVPLFSGYVFYDSLPLSPERVFASRRVAQILTPPDPAQLWRELNNLALALQHDQTMRETIFGEPGRPVWVARGVLKGLYGKLVRYGAHSQLVVQITFLGKAAELAIDEAFVEPIL